MVVRSETGDRLDGIYRGIVLKHLPAGKCKVFIPGVYDQSFYDDPDSLPTAQQRAAIFAGTNEGNGVFTYPNLSSIVWCRFLNGDANYPVYEAVTLGGEDAFGQYELIKRKDEPVSERHMITSGKTHMLWYEKGIISAIVEDPIRTQCSVDYDAFEKESNNISLDNKYTYSISNDLQEKVDKNQISNINCQYVLNNEGGAHGEISVSTHWYDIISSYLSDEQLSENGSVSTDNSFIMDNNGLLQLQTLSTYSVNTANGKEGTADTDFSKTFNQEKFTVDSTYDNIIDQKKMHYGATKDGSTSLISTETVSYEHHGHDADSLLSSRNQLTSIFVDIKNKQNINDIKSIQNVSEQLSAGGILHQSKLSFTTLSSDQNASSVYSRILKVTTEKEGNSSKGLQKVSILSSLKLNTVNAPITETKTAQLTSELELNSSGKSLFEVMLDYSLESQSQKKFIKSHDKVIEDVYGSHTQELKFNQGSGAGSTSEQVIDNKLTIVQKADNDATQTFSIVGKKLASGSPYVDGLYVNTINASTCQEKTTFVDNMVLHEYGNTLDVKTGKHEIFISDKNTGMQCIVVAKSDGTFELQTTTSVKIVSPAVTVQSPAITLDGPTHVTNVLNVDGATHIANLLTVDKDTITNEVSFNSHIHSNGNMGSPTGPRIK